MVSNDAQPHDGQIELNSEQRPAMTVSGGGPLEAEVDDLDAAELVGLPQSQLADQTPRRHPTT